MRNPVVKYILQNQVLFALLLLVLFFLIIQIGEIIILLFISYIITVALLPMVNFMNRKLPRGAAVLLTYLITIFLIILLIVPLVPFFTSQIQSLFNSFPKILNQAGKSIGLNIGPTDINSILRSEYSRLGSEVYNLTSMIFGGIFSLLALFVLSFYLSIDYKRLKRETLNLFPSEYNTQINTTITQIEEKLGSWLRGQILLSISIGILTWIALTILKMEYALPLALIAGILEIIPTIGPIISAVPAVIVAITISPAITFIVILNYIIIQMFENNVLVPKIMEKSVGLSPIIIIIAIMTGGKLLGILGALLSIPFISFLIIIFNNIRSNDVKS